VIGADMRSSHHARFDGVAERFQFAEHPVSAASSEMSAVFKSEPARPAFPDDADRLEIEAASFSFDALAFGVGDRDVLAGRASDGDVGEEAEVGNKSSCGEVADILVEADMGKVLRIKDAPPLDDLAGSNGSETGAVQAERPAARGGAEKVEHAHHGAMLWRLSHAA
jgi:hypothetical protein